MMFFLDLFGSRYVKVLKAKGDVKGLIKTLCYDRGEYGKSEEVQQAAAEALREIGTPAVTPLITAVKDRKQSEHCRFAAAKMLGQMDTLAVEPLIVLLTDNDNFVPGAAALALGEIGDARAVEPLITALTLTQNPNAVVEAAWALSKIGDIRAVEPTIELLEKCGLGAKFEVAMALINMGDIRALQPVLAVLELSEDTHSHTFKRIVMNLEGITSKSEDVEVFSLVVKAIVQPVFEWSDNVFHHSSDTGRIIDGEHKRAVAWFNQQPFASMPTGMGDRFVAEYCFDMAHQAQTSGNLQEAWAGYYQALERWLNLGNEKMVATTCWRLGQVYAARGQPDVAILFFIHSAYLNKELNNRQGYAWALFHLGHAFKDLKTKNPHEYPSDVVTKYLWMEALNVFRKVSPDDASELERVLQGLGGLRTPEDS